MLKLYDNIIAAKENREEEKRRKVADPMTLIDPGNFSGIKNLTEVHFGGKGFYRLQNFENFPNLEVVWLNKNNLVSLQGLKHNFRIKELYVFDNQLHELESEVFVNLSHIRILSIYNNKLEDLEKNLKILSKMPYLEQLSMSGNPFSNERNYRELTIKYLPRLKMLDRVTISDDDRRKIKKIFDNTERKKNQPELVKDGLLKKVVKDEELTFSPIELHLLKTVTKKTPLSELKLN